MFRKIEVPDIEEKVDTKDNSDQAKTQTPSTISPTTTQNNAPTAAPAAITKDIIISSIDSFNGPELKEIHDAIGTKIQEINNSSLQPTPVPPATPVVNTAPSIAPSAPAAPTVTKQKKPRAKTTSSNKNILNKLSKKAPTSWF
jgi:hypothetical protein